MRSGKTFFLALALILLCVTQAFAQDLPACEGPLNDFSRIIDRENKGKILALLREIEDRASIRIVVATLDSEAPFGVDNCAEALFEKCAFGAREKAALFVICVRERKVSILRTEALSGILEDGLVAIIEKSAVAPYMVEGRYGEGIYNGLIFMATLISQDTGIRFSNVREHAKIYPAVDWERSAFMATLSKIITAILAMVSALFLVRLYHSRQLKSKHGYHDIRWWTGGYGGGSGFSIGGFGGFGGGFS